MLYVRCDVTTLASSAPKVLHRSQLDASAENGAARSCSVLALALWFDTIGLLKVDANEVTALPNDKAEVSLEWSVSAYQDPDGRVFVNAPIPTWLISRLVS